MRYISRLVLVVWLAFVTVAGPSVLTGCKNVPVSRITYNTLSSIAVSVDSAMKSYRDSVKAGLVDEETQNSIKALHAKYQPVLHAAVVAAKFDFNSQAPEELAALAADLTTAIIVAIKKGGG